MTLFWVSWDFDVFRFRTVFAFEVPDRTDFVEVSSAVRLSAVLNKALAFATFLARGDFGDRSSDCPVTMSLSSSEGGGNEGGEELSGGIPKRRPGVHGDTDRAQFCSGDDEGITIASKAEVILMCSVDICRVALFRYAHFARIQSISFV